MFKGIKASAHLFGATSIGIVLAGITIAPLQAAAQDGHAHQGTARVVSSDNGVVVRDADTGKLRGPNAEERAELKAKADSQKDARIAPATTLQKSHGSGARGMRLTDEFTSMSVAVRNADGSVGHQCHSSHDHAHAAISAAGSSATKFETE